MSKYNPHNTDLSKGKMQVRKGYHKGTFLDDILPLIEILQNGAQVEIRAEELRTGKKSEQVQVLECRIYFAQPKPAEQ